MQSLADIPPAQGPDESDNLLVPKKRGRKPAVQTAQNAESSESVLKSIPVEAELPADTQITMTKAEYDSLMFAKHNGLSDAQLGQELLTFETKVSRAKAMGEEYVEASEELINHFNPLGMNGSEYFIYKGIKVFPHGKAEIILKEENIPLAKKIFGPKSPNVNV